MQWFALGIRTRLQPSNAGKSVIYVKAMKNSTHFDLTGNISLHFRVMRWWGMLDCVLEWPQQEFELMAIWVQMYKWTKQACLLKKRGGIWRKRIRGWKCWYDAWNNLIVVWNNLDVDWWNNLDSWLRTLVPQCSAGMSTQTGLLERLETEGNFKALVCASRVQSRACSVDVFTKGQASGLVKNFEAYGSDV